MPAHNPPRMVLSPSKNTLRSSSPRRKIFTPRDVQTRQNDLENYSVRGNQQGFPARGTM